MKKQFLIIIPIAVAIAIAFIMIMVSNRQVPAWRSRLDQYLTYLHTTGQASLRVVDYSSASRPANFTPDMSVESFSDSGVFQIARKGAEFTAGIEAIPYPPVDVVCVLLTDGRQIQLVYVAMHHSLYNADWVVHISSAPWDSPLLQASISNLGCELSE